MNKKFLSAILFGALMVTSTGTFVSCKDYDDDIDQLWDAVNGQKTELGTKVAAVESSISSLQSAQSAMDSKIADAKDAAEKAALEAQKAAIEAAAKDLAAAKAELQEAMDKLNSDNKAVVEAVKEDVKKTEAALAEANGKIIALQAFQGTTEKTLDALAQANATLSSALTSLEEQVKANAEAIGKNKAAIEAQLAALNAYKTSNDAAVAANAAAIEEAMEQLGKHQEVLNALDAFDVEETKTTIEGLKAETQKLSEDITAINNNLEVLSAAIYKGVTHVSLVATTANSDEYKTSHLELLSAEAVRTWVFGDKLPGAIEFKAGERTTFEKSFIIRVSPTDAVISAENITLVNSKGNNLEGLVEVADVQPYQGLMSVSRGISATGLWEVSVKMNANYDADAFEAATKFVNDDKQERDILYAVSLNTTLGEGVTSRNVVSEYDLTFVTDNEATSNELKFTVDKKDVTEISNRYDVKEDKKWKDQAEAEPIYKTEGDRTENVTTDKEDDRDETDFKAYPVTLNKAFTVAIEDENVRGFYVTIDYDRAGDSDTSEKVAWKKYEPSIKGLNTVTETGSIDLTITDADALTDYICFRVYAVNRNGSLVDPDGKAFEVVVGNAAEELSAYSVQQTWKANGDYTISTAEVAEGVFGDWMEGLTVTTETDQINDKDAFTVTYSTDGETYDDITTITSKVDIKSISVELNGDLKAYEYEDNKTYSSKVIFKNSRQQVIKTLTVNFKKVLPTFPTTFQAKVNQLNAEGTLKAFMTPVNGGKEGQKDLTQSFNGLKDAKNSYDKNFIFTFAAAQVEGEEVKDKVIAYNNGYTFEVGADFIDNETMHAVTVEYNFGMISSEAKDEEGEPVDYTVKGGEFKNIIFACLADINTYAWANEKGLSLTYEKGSEAFYADVNVTNARDGKYSVNLEKLLAMEGADKMITKITGCELWSQDENGEKKEGSMNEYFIPAPIATLTAKDKDGKVIKTGGIKFTPNSNAQNPEATVPSILIIKGEDYFGHPVEIKIDNVNVKKR